MFRVYLIFVLCMFCDFVKNDKILALFPYQGKSHFNMFDPLMKELEARGHEVDVMGHFPLNTPRERHTDLSISGSLPTLMNNLTLEAVGKSVYDGANYLFKNAGVELCKTVLNHPVARKLKNTTKKYDILITEIFGTDCMLGFAHHFKIPSIGIVSCTSFPWVSDMIGLPDNPSYIPNNFLSYMPKMNLKERVVNTLVLFLIKLGYKMYSVKYSNVYVRDFFGENTPDLEELARNFSLLLVNSHFSLHQSRPFVPNFIEVGGMHIGQEKSLPKHLEEAVNSYPSGTIYLSFGSMILSEAFPENKLQALYDALGELPYKVLWKGDKDKLSKSLKIPKNIQYEKWLPQLDLLCHPNVKLFISHGGIMGTQESVHCETPILGIPLFGEQELNIKICVAKGVAIEVAYNNITKDSIRHATKELLHNPQYEIKMKSLSKLFRDRPLSALDTAIYWIEYVSRHKGAPHLRSVGADLPWYQYFLVDVAGVILAGFFFIVMSIYYFFFIIYRLIRKTTNKVKTN